MTIITPLAIILSFAAFQLEKGVMNNQIPLPVYDSTIDDSAPLLRELAPLNK